MRKINSIAVFTVFWSVLAAASSQPAAADQDHIRGTHGYDHPSSRPAWNGTKLVQTKASSGYVAKHLAVDGFTALDARKTISCPAPTTSCRIEIDQNAIFASGSLSGIVGICSQIDGVFITPCENLGFIPLIRQTKNFVQFLTVASGDHTVQTFVYSDKGGMVAAWGVTYRAYQ